MISDLSTIDLEEDKTPQKVLFSNRASRNSMLFCYIYAMTS